MLTLKGKEALHLWRRYWGWHLRALLARLGVVKGSRREAIGGPIYDGSSKGSPSNMRSFDAELRESTCARDGVGMNLALMCDTSAASLRF